MGGKNRSRSPKSPLQEQAMLHMRESHWSGAFLAFVRHAIDPRAHGIAPHQPCIEGLQKFGRRSGIPHTRIEPQVVAIWKALVKLRYVFDRVCSASGYTAEPGNDLLRNSANDPSSKQPLATICC